MPYVPYKFPLTGGIDRNVAPLAANRETFIQLINMRQSGTGVGQLERTPCFSVLQTMNRGTYLAAATEPSASAVMFWDSNIVLTEFCAWTYAGTQLKVLKQTAFPSGSSLTKGCLLVLENPGTATVNLNAAYDIEIDGASTFQWRVNGGAWTSLVAINATSGNSIDGGAARVYWLTGTGFTVADRWTWTRTDFTEISGLVGAPETLRVGRDYYYVNSARRVYKVEYTTNGYYVRTVGYQPVEGNRLVFFENHLFVLRSTVYTENVICSDVSNLDNFFPTDTNEADIFTLVGDDKTSHVADIVVLDAAVAGTRMYVLTSSGLYYTDYAGLPTPFSFKELLPFGFTQNTATVGRILSCPAGMYIATALGLFSFDGVQIRPLFVGMLAPHDLLYNALAFEVVVTNTSGNMLCYQVRYGTLYFRFADVGSNTAICTGNGIRLGLTSRRVAGEVSFSASGTVLDSTTPPTLIMQPIGGERLAVVKESAPIYFGVTLPSSGPGFSTGSNIRINVEYLLTNGYVLVSDIFTSTNKYWSSASPDGKVDFPRLPYRGLAYKFTITGHDGVKPPGAVILTAVETSIYVEPESNPTR